MKRCVVSASRRSYSLSFNLSLFSITCVDKFQGTSKFSLFCVSLDLYPARVHHQLGDLPPVSTNLLTIFPLAMPSV